MGRSTTVSKNGNTKLPGQIPPVFLASHSNDLPACSQCLLHLQVFGSPPASRSWTSWSLLSRESEKQWKTITVRRLLPHALLHLFATELSNGLKPNSDLKGIIGQVLMPSLTTPGTPQFWSRPSRRQRTYHMCPRVPSQRCTSTSEVSQTSDFIESSLQFHHESRQSQVKIQTLRLPTSEQIRRTPNFKPEHVHPEVGLGTKLPKHQSNQRGPQGAGRVYVCIFAYI